MLNKIDKYTSIIYSLKILTHICRYYLDLNKTILYAFKVINILLVIRLIVN